MARRWKKVVRKGSDDCYIQLVRVVPLRPIRSDIELDRAIAMIDSLVDQAELPRRGGLLRGFERSGPQV